jgi:response regulator NasT
MGEDETRHLRVLIANEKRERLELLAQVVAGLGHEVIAREIYVKEVGAVTARERPDVALVGLGLHSEHALELITEIVREASCPVIALLSAKDPAYVHEAAKRGVFAYIVDGSPEELQSAIDITLQRFAEYHSLQGAFGRRATIEQAKGILMARHASTPTERSRCCATTRNTTATSSSTSPRRSSTATSCCCRRFRNRRHLPSGQPSQRSLRERRLRGFGARLRLSASAIGAKNRSARAQQPASRKVHPQHSGLEQYLADHNALGRRRSFEPGGPDGGDSRRRSRRHVRARAHAPSRRTIRPLVGLVRRSAREVRVRSEWESRGVVQVLGAVESWLAEDGPDSAKLSIGDRSYTMVGRPTGDPRDRR